MSKSSFLAPDQLEYDDLKKLLGNIHEFLFKGKSPYVSRSSRGGKEAKQIVREICGLSSDSTAYRVMTQTTINYWEQGVKVAVKLIQHFGLIVDQNLGVNVASTQQDVPILRLLAEKLAYNLVDVSTPTDQQEIPYSSILKTEEFFNQREPEEDIIRERFIAIVGADASTAATAGKDPMADHQKSAGDLRKKFEGVKDTFIDKKTASIRQQSSAPDLNDFELTVQALCDFDRDLVVEGLQELCGYRHTPSLSYEIIAHLLKHRFLDVVVNFNIDELLDNAIAEELPDQDDYRFIYTAGHCPQKVEDLYIDYRLRKPMYVKCHGTISHPNSMRLEGKKAFVTEPAIQKHLSQTFVGKLDRKYGNRNEELPLNLIIIGFALDNVAFNRLLNNVLSKKEEKVYVWLFEFDAVNGEEGEVAKRIRRIFEKAEYQYTDYLKRIPVRGSLSLDTQLTSLWETTSNYFSEPYVPQGVARHELTNYVFKDFSPNKLNHDREHRGNYLTGRLYLEIAIMILQTDGFIHLSRLGNNRAGKFYQLLRESGDDRRHIGKHLAEMGLKKYNGFMHDTYHIPDEKFKRREKENNKSRSKKEILDYVIDQLKKKKKLFSPNVLSGKNKIKTFRDMAEIIQTKRLGMINPKYTHIHGDKFSDVKTSDVMNTSLAWVYNYREFLTPEGLEKWDVMLTVTEKGRFFYHDLLERTNTDFSNKAFAVVLARFDQDAEMTDYTKKLKNKLPPLGDGLRFRSWWTHNQHMVIFLKRKPVFDTKTDSNQHFWKNDWERVGGFYYTSRLLSRRISPVQLKSYDLTKAMTDFAIYYHGTAEAYEDEIYRPIVNKSTIDDTLNNLLWSYKYLYPETSLKK